MPQPQAVVFDLDGTLLDTMVSVPRVYVDTIRSLGGPQVQAADVIAVWHIGPTAVVLEHFLGRPVAAADIECYHRHHSAAAAVARPFPGVVEMLGALGRAGYRLGVFTAATRRAADLMLDGTGLAGCFTAVVGGDEVGRPKPAPAGLRLACRRLGAPATGAVYVGDTEGDIRCAEAAGSVAVHATWSAGTVLLAGEHLVARCPADVVDLLAGIDPPPGIDPPAGMDWPGM